jgi:hypothetical protein
MRNGFMLIGWIALLTLLASCATTEPRDSKDRPRVGVIGHGTTPGYSWAGVGVTVPFPGKQPSAPSPPSEQNSKESGKVP